MSVRRVVLSSFVLVVLARATCAVAEDSSDKAVLGPAVPIGELLVLKASFDDEPQLLPSTPIPLLDPKPFSVPPGLLLAPTNVTVPEGYGLPGNEMLKATARITPSDMIAVHLHHATLSLAAAGFNEEAEQASSLLKKFQAKHQPRLVLAAKQAQLNALQAEIERLKLQVDKEFLAEQIHISLKIIEADEQAAKELLGDDVAAVFTEPADRLQSAGRVLDRNEFLQLIESKRKEGSLKVLAEPTLVVLPGRPARFRSGGSIPTPRIAQAGGPAELEYGTTVQATATILDKDLIRVALTAEYGKLHQSKNADHIPTVDRSRVQSTLELKDGQTVIVGGLVNQTQTKTVATIIAITAEIIHPTPFVPQVEGFELTPPPIRPVK